MAWVEYGIARHTGNLLNLQADEIVKKILTVRGILGDEAVREFLSDRPKLAHDPQLLPGMEAGVDFLIAALMAGKRICVYGDYDVDGVCGTALLVLFLRHAANVYGGGSAISFYIPSRIEEGYGLNKAALRAIKDEGGDAVVTVDCGSVSAEEAAYAREIGLDILITDHHAPDPANLPDCACINPKLRTADGGGYPFEKICGAAVAFKLCGALQGRMGDRGKRAVLHGLVDLVCVATISDVMPLIDENRTFVKYGLSLLRKGSRPALKALASVAGIKAGSLTSRDVAFGLAPRINALGRIGDASLGVEFFLAEDEERICQIALLMDACNTERRQIQDACFDECMSLFEADQKPAGNPQSLFLLLKPKNAHEGVSGIVAGKVREETGLPCAVLAASGDRAGGGPPAFLKGSVRSAGRLDVIALLRRHAGIFERLGGHAAAAGFLIKAENEAALREALSRDLAELLDSEPNLLAEEEGAELEIEAADISPALADAALALAPFGNGNQKPLLLFRVRADAIAGIRFMGAERRHLRFKAAGIPCVFFGGAKTVFPGTGLVGIVGCPEINEWNGSRNIQFAVRHVFAV